MILNHKKGDRPRLSRGFVRRSRGAALLLVLIAVAVATILALSFLATQGPTSAVATNIDRKAKARQIAESALEMAIDYVNEDADWRTDKASGQWMTGAAMDGGTFDLYGTDEDDGELSDDDSDAVLLVVVATYEGVTHRVSARVTPGGEEPSNRLLLVVSSSASPNSRDRARQALFESWGYTVTLLDDGASGSAYTEALAVNDVVYISEESNSGSIGTKLSNTTLGVVNEEGQLHDELRMATSGADDYDNDNAITILDSGHPVTSGLPAGEVRIFSSNMQVVNTSRSLGSGVSVLADAPAGDDDAAVLVADVGDALTSGSAPGRRVILPFGDNFDVADLTTDGETLVRQAIAWAGGGGSASGLTADWFDVSGWPRELEDVDWDDAPLMTTVEADIDWSSTGSPWMSGLPSDNFAVELTGTVTAPTSGTWTFYLNSDDGSELLIDGSQVIDNDGLHGMRERSGSVSMTAGQALPIRVRFFERGGGAGLILSWSGPGQSKQVVPESAFAGAAEESGPEPTLLALYDFQEQAVADPALVGHWKLDEQAGGVGVLMGDELRVYNGSMIDGYSAADGAYGGSNRHQHTAVVVNATGWNDVMLTSGSTIHGDVQVGSGADPDDVIALYSGSTITGSQTTQDTNTPIQSHDAPPGFEPHRGNQSYNGGSHTWSTDQHFNQLTLNNGATVRVSGDVQVRVSNRMSLNNGDIILDPGATLTLWLGHDLTINNNSTINNDPTRPGDLTIIQYGNNRDVTLNHGAIAGRLHVADDLTLNNNAQVYGSVVVEDALTINSGALHIDSGASPIGAGGGGSLSTASDSTDTANSAMVHGSISGGAEGVIGTAFALDGNDDYVVVPHDPSYLLNAGSVGLHFYPTNLGGAQGLFSKDSSGRDNGGHLSIYTDGTRLKARIQTDGSDPYLTGDDIELESASGALSADTWHHALVTWGDGQFRLYLDGVLVDAANHLGGLGTTSGGSGNDEPIVLGAMSDNSGDQSATPVDSFFTGRIDDVRLYDLPLDAAQASSLAGGVEPGPRTAPGYIALDTSGYATAADLIVYDPTAINWVDGGGLQFTGDTLATTLGSAPKLHDAIHASEAFAVELIFERATPASTDSPSHIVGYTNASNNHNFMLGQDGGKYEARVRDDATGGDANLSPEFISTSNLAESGQTHLVLSYHEGNVSVYIDGSLDKTASTSGTLDNWANDLLLVVGGAYSGSRYWNGTIKRLAIYNDALDDTQANNVYNGEAPGPGGSGTGGAGLVDWDEED